MSYNQIRRNRRMERGSSGLACGRQIKETDFNLAALIFDSTSRNDFQRLAVLSVMLA
jgi:hypothetical protein